MGAPDLLQHLRSEGFSIGLTAEGRVSVAPAHALTDAHRDAIRSHRDELAALLMPANPAPAAMPAGRCSGNPLMTAEQCDACHVGGWADAEIERFTGRITHLMRRGIPARAADDLAERLTLRDRQGDERRMCVECANLSERGRCLVSPAGRFPGAGRRLEPVQTILQRCEAFTLRKGLA